MAELTVMAYSFGIGEHESITHSILDAKFTELHGLREVRCNTKQEDLTAAAPLLVGKTSVVVLE